MIRGLVLPRADAPAAAAPSPSRCPRGAAFTALLLLLWVAPAELVGVVAQRDTAGATVAGRLVAVRVGIRAPRTSPRTLVAPAVARLRAAGQPPCRWLRPGRGVPAVRAPGVAGAGTPPAALPPSSCRV